MKLKLTSGDQELHAPLTEPARCPLGLFSKWRTSVVGYNVSLGLGWATLPRSFPWVFPVRRIRESFLRPRTEVKGQPLCSLHVLSFIFVRKQPGLPLLRLPCILLQHLWLLGQECGVSALTKGPSFRRASVPSRLEATRTVPVSFHLLDPAQAGSLPP